MDSALWSLEDKLNNVLAALEKDNIAAAHMAALEVQKRLYWTKQEWTDFKKGLVQHGIKFGDKNN